MIDGILKVGDIVGLHGTILDFSITKVEDISGIQFFEGEVVGNLYIGFVFGGGKEAIKVAREIERNQEDFPNIYIRSIVKEDKRHLAMIIFVSSGEDRSTVNYAREEVKKAIDVFAKRIS